MSGAQELASTGPAWATLVADGDVDTERWRQVAARLEPVLPATPDSARLIHHLYVPILFWLEGRIRRVALRPLVAGISGPQGAGKSTLVRCLLPLLEHLGWRVASVSIDDFYLTHADQLRLAAEHPGNPYLQFRGYPGTHDVALGASSIESLRDLGPGEARRVPAYDKSLHRGRGDRLPESAWPIVRGPLDLVLVEGWMLGFTPVRTSDPFLAVVDERLAAYEAWLRLIDAMVIFRTADVRTIVRWRVAAEDAMRRSGRPALDPTAAEDYARRFVPAYQSYAATVANGRWAPSRQLELFLDEQRLPVRR